MNDTINSNKQILLLLGRDEDCNDIIKTARAFASQDRIDILRLLIVKPLTIYEISKRLNMPISTVSNHISILEDAHMIYVSVQQGHKRHVKMCSIQFNTISFNVGGTGPLATNTPFSVELPVGHFSNAKIHPPCGLYVINKETGEERMVSLDTPVDFFSPDRFFAELIWFTHGFITYTFPNKLYDKTISKLELSFELCSEIIHHRMDWPSDISIQINGVDALTFTSPGDYGGRRGKYSSLSWSINSTQYGKLYKITITTDGVYLNDIQVSKTPITDFFLTKSPSVEITIGVKQDALHCGGLNLFGKNFGDYNQALILSLYP